MCTCIYVCVKIHLENYKKKKKKFNFIHKKYFLSSQTWSLIIFLTSQFIVPVSIQRFHWILRCVFLSFFFFFLRVLGRRQNLLFMRQISLFTHCSSTFHTLFMGPTATLFKKILKMGPTILFTHLKIILLQFFQFSIFSFQFQ